RRNVWLEPGLDTRLDVRAQTGPAEAVEQDRLHLPALQVPDQGQRQLAVWGSHRGTQDIFADDVGLPGLTSPTAIGMYGLLIILLDQERHTKRPVLGQINDFLGQGIISGVPLGAA